MRTASNLSLSVRPVIAFAVACLLRVTTSGAPQAERDLPALLEAVANRVTAYYHRAESVVCTEVSTVQPIDRQWSSQGFARTVESQLRLELEDADGDALPDGRIVRDIRRVNGRLPRESDQKSRSGCNRGLAGPVDVRVPSLLQRRYRFDPYLVIDRDDVSMRFKPVAFMDPDEVLLLPETIESITVLRSGLQSTRRTERFSEYRRFLTAARIRGR